MFGIKPGFDIVIGNPPYVHLENMTDVASKLYRLLGFETYAPRGDLYALFYERGWQLLHENAHLCFITSNKWMRSGYGESLRKFLSVKTQPRILIDFAGQRIFESATVDTNILLFEKALQGSKPVETQAVTATEGCHENLGVFVRQHAIPMNFPADGSSWVILNPIEQSIKRKIETVGIPLKEWNIKIYRGILTGFNDAFIISEEKRDEILANCKTADERKRTVELIRPILRGRDIKRYSYEWAHRYIIATFPALHIDIEKYPEVKKFLHGFYPKLRQTGQPLTVAEKQSVKAHMLVHGLAVNEKDLDKSRKMTSNKWFETQDQIDYWDDFSKPKIVYPNMTKFMPFLFDTEGFMTNQKCFIIVGKNIAFLTAFLNSSLFKYLFRDAFPELLGGTRELSKIFFDKIPVRKVSKEENARFEKVVSRIQSATDENEKKLLGMEIDAMVFDLYELTEPERKTIGYIEIK
jgi:hypothetical protein